ncbi:MAG TPA: L,D-transpeptidase [Polyangiaceae bacterium]
MRPVRAIGVTLLVPALGCGEAQEVPPAARVAPLAPRGSASASAAPERTERDRVTLGGAVGAPAAVEAGKGPRVYAKALRAWIVAHPSRNAERFGLLRAGASLPTTGQAAGTEGCPGGYYPVEPRGFVCVGPTATLDANDPVVVLSAAHPPDFSRKLPYVYGTVRNPGPVYGRLPSSAELRTSERDVDERMPAWLAAEGEIGAGYGQEVWLGRPGTPPDPAKAWAEHSSDAVSPLILKGGAALGDDGVAASELVRARMRPKVGYSFLETFLFEGRRYGLSTDLGVLPTDRLRPIRGSDFHGVEIGKEVALPFAFVRREGAHFVRLVAGKLEDAGATRYRMAVPLTGKQQFFKGRLHFETKDGTYLADRDASRIDPAKRMPAWGKNGERWLDVNITKQTLVAYDGERPIFATLISTGEAGLEDHERTTATKRGIFRIHTKYVTATMSSDEVGEEFELRDVPYVQFFEEGYALHGAYWHDRFGTPKSHGCINLSPEDARRLFFFTEPALPSGWHGVLKPLTGTVLFVHP